MKATVKRQLHKKYLSVRDQALQQAWVASRRPRAYWFKDHPNFGDALSPVILRLVTGQRPVWVSRSYRGKMLGVGSLLSFSLSPGDTVWGTGLIADRVIIPPPETRFLAVRGPLTRARIRADVPAVYGDPAILLGSFVDSPVQRRYDVGIVPHVEDYRLVVNEDPKILVVDVTRHWAEVIDAIRSCHLILSSSLHGIIAAEAFAIPAVWVRMSDRIIGGNFKFHDYLLGTGREASEPIDWWKGLEQATKRPLQRPVFDPSPLLDAAQNLLR